MKSVVEHLSGHEHAGAQRRFTARSVAVVGFMGVGKTSVGREVARLLNRPFIDTDAEVEARSGRTIPQLFAEGEPVFRAFEQQCILDALDQPPSVIALGGGAFSQPGAAELLLGRAIVVHLYTSWNAMLPRLIALADDRPMIASRAPWQVQDLFMARAASYRRAHVRVALRRGGVAEAVAAVAAVLTVHHPAVHETAKDDEL